MYYYLVLLEVEKKLQKKNVSYILERNYVVFSTYHKFCYGISMHFVQCAKKFKNVQVKKNRQINQFHGFYLFVHKFSIFSESFNFLWQSISN